MPVTKCGQQRCRSQPSNEIVNACNSGALRLIDGRATGAGHDEVSEKVV